MNTIELKVSKVNALKAWRNTDKGGRLLLENLYGEKLFQNQDVRDRIKTLEDALAETGRPDTPDFSDVPENMKTYFEAQYKMSVIAEALNEGWAPDWGNSNEKKWRPWFVIEGVLFRFDFSYYDFSDADSGSSSRLCFRTEELSTYCAEQFLHIWKDIQLG